MVLNTWWERDEAQPYWMEVATTGAMGEILIAPKFQGAHWSYELVGHVRPGDVILHWQSSGGVRGLVGWSVATSEPEVAPEYTWQPRGTAGRSLPGPRTTAGWMVPLGGFNAFDTPLTTDELQSLREPILAVADTLEARNRKPIYFPFYLWGGRQLRAQQGYLMKFPLELFSILRDLQGVHSAATHRASQAVDDYRPAEDDAERRKRRVARGSVTRIQDPVLRAAVEAHAVDRAIDYFAARGGTDFVKLGKPYDVQFQLDGQEHHIEVKGSSLQIETIELTRNEVSHARQFQPAHLVVVDDIDWKRNGEGRVMTTGGRLRVWSLWTPDDRDLIASKYAYQLPEGARQ